MLRPVFVVVIAMLLMPSVLAARQPESKDATHAADPPATPAAAPGNPASRSLMGMVMGALIQSAEQQAASQAGPGKAKAPAAGAKPPGQADIAAEQIAVQSEP